MTLWFSLRRRLLVVLLGGLSVCWIVMMIWSFFDARHEINEIFDAQLAQAGQVLLALSSSRPEGRVPNSEEDDAEAVKIGHKYQRRLRFQIWGADGRLLLRSHGAPETPLTHEEDFSETGLFRDRWRHYSQWNKDHTRQVQVSENYRIRDKLNVHIAFQLLFPALFGLPILGLWVWLATRQSLSSLKTLAGEIARQAPLQLQPVSPVSAPVEIRPLVEALNGLLHRVEKALVAERRFTADAAHELRTPLAGLQAQLQVALRARDEAERDHSLANVLAGLGRASRLVEQMLQLARLDPEHGLPEGRAIDLGQLAETVCADLGPLILKQNMEFDLRTQADVKVEGQQEWLEALLRNLIDNALRYSPPGSRLTVEAALDRGRPFLAVSDSGPGIPREAREAVLRRFHRLEGNEAPGTGLGLSIVARIAELHGATLTLEDSDPAPGLRVRLAWESGLRA